MLAAMREYSRTHGFNHRLRQHLMQRADREVEVFHRYVEDQPKVVVIA
jgi:hypothetical protein